MSTGQRLREVKEEITRIERFLPVMKRVLTMLRSEIRHYQERVDKLDQQWALLERQWQEHAEHPLAATVAASLRVETVTRMESLVGVDIEEIATLAVHSRLSEPLVCSSTTATALTDLAIARDQADQRLLIERRNLARLEDAEEEFVFLINGSEQVRLPPLREEMARLARGIDEENGMSSTIARLLRERTAARKPHEDQELWLPLA